MKKGILFLLTLLPFTIMAQKDNTVTEKFLQSFVDAFNAHDIGAIMAHMTEDCVFQASAGSDMDGEKFTGAAEVRKAFEDVFTTFPDAKWSNPRHLISGDRGLSEWIFTGTRRDGARVEVTGCDLFTFRDGKIAIKNSYRKNRVSAK